MVKPYESQKVVYESLKSATSLLPDADTAAELFKKFEDLSEIITR